MKKILLSLLFAAVIIILVFLYIKSQKFNRHLKVLVISAVSGYVGSDIKIDRIRTDILSSIVLTGVAVYSPDGNPVLEIDKVIVNYSLWKMLRRAGSLLNMITGVSLYGPDLELVYSEGSFIVKGLEKVFSKTDGETKRIFPPWKIKVRKGNILVTLDKERSVDITRFDAAFLLGGYPEININSSFSAGGFADRVSINGALHLIKEDFRVTIEASDVDLKQLGKEIIPGKVDELKSGMMDFKLRCEGNINSIMSDLRTIKTSGEISLEEVEVLDFKILSARFNVLPVRLKLDQGVFRWKDNPLDISGTVSDYLHKPELMLKASGLIKAQELLEGSPLKEVKGEFKIESEIDGMLDDLIIKGTLHMDKGQVAGIDIIEFKSALNYSREGLKLGNGSADIAGGKAIWEGEWSPVGKIDIGLSAENINIAKIINYEKISGSFGGEIKISGNTYNPVINSNVTMENLVLAGRKFEHLTLKSGYKENRISLNGFTINGDYNILAELELGSRDKKDINIRKLDISGPEGEIINVTGGLGISPFRFKILVDGHKVNTNDIPMAKILYEDIKGSLDIKGTVEYSIGNISLDTQIQTAELSIRDKKYFLACRLDLFFGTAVKKVKLTDINLNNYLSGFAAFEKGTGGFIIQSSEIRLNNADIRELIALSNKGIGIEHGSADGFFNVSENKGTGELKISGLKAAGMDIGDTDIKFDYSPSNIVIDQMRTVKKEGYFIVSGTVYPAHNIEMAFSDYEMNNRIIDGSLKYSGSSDKPGSFGIKIDGKMMLNKTEWPEFSLAGSYEEKKLKLRLDTDGTIKGDSVVVFKDKVSVESDIWLKKFQLPKLLDAAGVSINTEGMVSGALKIMGAGAEPLIYFKGNMENGNWRNILYAAELSAEYQNSGFRIGYLEGKAAGGTVKIKGTGNNEEGLKMSCSVEQVELAELAGLIDTIDKISGKADALISVSGLLTKPDFDIDLTAKGLNIGDMQFDSVRSKLSLSGKEIDIDEIETVCTSGTLKLRDGKAIIKNNRDFSIDVLADFKNIRTGPLAILGTGKIQGDIRTIPLGLDIRVIPRKLLINRLGLQDELTLTYKDKLLEFAVKDGVRGELYLDYPDRIQVRSLSFEEGTRKLEVSGIYSPAGTEGKVHARNIEINNIIRLLDSPLELSGSSDFNLVISGDAEKMNLKGDIELDKCRYVDVVLGNIKSGFFYSDGILHLSDTLIRNPQFMDIQIDGSIGKKSLDLNIIINRLSLALLSEFSGEISKGAGYFLGKFKIKGSFQKPDIKGNARLEGGTVSGKNIINKIRDIECSITGEGSRLNLESINAEWKPGNITGSGYIDFGKRPLDLKLSLSTQGDRGGSVKIPYLDIPQSSIFGRYLTLPSYGEPLIKLDLYNTDEGYVLKGDVTLINTHFTYPPAKGSAKAGGFGIMDDITIDIDLRAAESVWYENTYARVKINGGLNFRKPPGKKLMVNGTITSNEGELTYFNREYRVKEANLRFEDSIEYLDAVAATDIQRKMIDGLWEDDEIELIIQPSRVADIKLRFSSSRYAEQTSSEEAMELTIAGVELKNLSREERNLLMRQEILRAIDANLTTPLVKNILKRTELIDVAKVDVKVSETADEERRMFIEGAGLEVGRYFTDRFYMGYYMQFGGFGLEDKLRLSHELDMLYRVQGSQFLRGRVSEEEKFFGVEQRIKF
ncbi:MAG: translocation/assembly module TamB domain-containing protein [Elusimicrobiota bacterium]